MGTHQECGRNNESLEVHITKSLSQETRNERCSYTQLIQSYIMINSIINAYNKHKLSVRSSNIQFVQSTINP